MKTLALFLLSLVLSLQLAAADPGFDVEQLFLYQPDSVLSSRLPDINAFAAYEKEVEKVCTTHFANAKDTGHLYIVIAIKPGKQSRVWLIPSSLHDTPSLDALTKSIEKISPLDVYQGPIVFAISSSINGGKDKARDPQAGPPIPQAWRDAVKDQKSSIEVPEGFLKLVWPDPPQGNPHELDPQPGFVTQVLEPTGGKISMPKDWHYTESHRPHVLMWTLTKEDTQGGKKPYVTGMRIQFFVGIKEGIGKTPKEFLQNFIKEKKASGAHIVESCGEKEEDRFTRSCLETEEGPFHILYSLFWPNDDADMAVVTIAGTNKELWNQYAATFAKMNRFELLDAEHMTKK